MPLFDECCVLIPASTLEDFPSDLSDYDARSLLAAWTVLWHPSLLAEVGQLPAWYRADSPPDVLDNRLIAAPAPSLSRLPDGFADRADKHSTCLWLQGESRDELLQRLPWDRLPACPPESLRCGPREIRVDDFFAAGYATLQIQVMTRRLRYTSNLDELHLQNCAVAAARAFIAGDSEGARDGLHNLFDCLAEERDHYFSSDPHLIDLVLTSPSTIARLLESLGSDSDPSGHPPVEVAPTTDSGGEPAEASDASGPFKRDDAVLATPLNVLIDGEVSEAVTRLDGQARERLQDLLSGGTLGWAGGGPPASVCLDAMTFAQAEQVLEQVHQQSTQSLGMAPPVYGRFSGATPSDLTATLVRLGYLGMMPIDFAGGTGFGDEAKVILQAGGAQMEALTAKPIDAASPRSFLTLGTRLGESIDSGEIATALLAHWPGASCDAFEDLKRAASWSLCLGRFWNLADYFREGEHPYHHGTAVTASPRAAELLPQLVASKTPDPISSLAESFRRSVADEQRSILAGMRDLITGTTQAEADPVPGLAAAIGAPVCADSGAASSADALNRSKQGEQSKRGEHKLIVNSTSAGCRCGVFLDGPMSAKSEHLYAVSTEAGLACATIDVPGCGFVLLSPSRGEQRSGGLSKRLREKLFGGPAPIAEKELLQNEFMEVTLNAESGGVSGVYSGARGNRFSLRLIADGADADKTVMQCDHLKVLTSTASLGCVEATGTLRRRREGKGQPGGDDQLLARFRLRYSLERGSRFLRVDGQIEPEVAIQGDPWLHYLGVRTAVASESPICRTLVRDKLHRARSRRMVAPLGLLLDEAERQTLVCGEGLAFHRRVGERFLDTLVVVEGESRTDFTLHYGFDVPSAVAASRGRITPPVEVVVTPKSGTPEIGWMLHLAPKDLLLSGLTVRERSDGRLAALIRIIQTQPQACKVKLRCFRNVAAAVLLDGPLEATLDRSDEELEKLRTGQRSDLQFEGDLVRFSMPSHGVTDLMVVFNQA